jgi:hypothetical protein
MPEDRSGADACFVTACKPQTRLPRVQGRFVRRAISDPLSVTVHTNPLPLSAWQEMVALYRRFNGIVPFLPFTEKEQVGSIQPRAVLHGLAGHRKQSISLDPKFLGSNFLGSRSSFP